MPVKGMGSRLSGLIILVDAGFVVNISPFPFPLPFPSLSLSFLFSLPSP